jgi:hypothetical protein
MDKSRGHYVKWSNPGTEKNTARSHLYEKSKNVELLKIESRMVLPKGYVWGRDLGRS